MSTLHTVNKSPFASSSLQSCIGHCRDDDAILMIEDGVYGCLAGTEIAEQLVAKAGSISVFVLTPDANARGIASTKMFDGINGVDYDGFVDLVTDHARTQAWL